MRISRRHFLAGGAAVVAAPLGAAPLGLPIGCQLYPVREMIGKDFAGTLKELKAIGYSTVELCSPPGYEKSGFGALIKLGAAGVRSAFKTAGLSCESSHYGFRELKENLDDRIAYAKELGLKQMVVSTFGLPAKAGLADWARAAGELNSIAERIRKAGMQTGFHNHNFEVQTIDGVLVYDHLMSKLDASLVKMQFQVGVISLGFQAATFMEKYPGRFLSLHLADWSDKDKKQVAVGSGVVDWKKLFAAAKTGGVKNYYVEMNLDLMKASVPYLRTLKV